MSERIERLEAELKLAKLEEKFIQAKADGKVTPKMKQQLRQARYEFRTYREQVRVRPGTVSGSVDAPTPGAGD